MTDIELRANSLILTEDTDIFIYREAFSENDISALMKKQVEQEISKVGSGGNCAETVRKTNSKDHKIDMVRNETTDTKTSDANIVDTYDEETINEARESLVSTVTIAGEGSDISERKVQVENDKFLYNNHDESIYDDISVFPSLRPDSKEVTFDENNELLNHGTIRAIIVQLTSPEVIDYNFIYDFFLSYRLFVDSEKLLRMLLTRLIWSFQYIMSPDNSKHKTGTLVLLRTFVVIRHWILNYFYDDFQKCPFLCDAFSSSINEICLQSNFLGPKMVFERKVIRDLKCHWLSLLSRFWMFQTNPSELSEQEAIDFELPMYRDLPECISNSQSQTDMSIHTNPSFRRSAMLSLYDPNVQKGISTNSVSEINSKGDFNLINSNLVLSFKSSRASLNNKIEYLNRRRKQVPSTDQMKLKDTQRHNCIHVNDSSLGLKKVVKSRNSATNALNQRKEYSLMVGFSTNGYLRIPSAKVDTILPPTPVKKMDIIIKDLASNSNELLGKEGIFSDDEIRRKKSIKKIVENWKNPFTTFNQPKDAELFAKLQNQIKQVDLDVNKIDVKINSSGLDTVDVLSAKISDELETLIRDFHLSFSSSSRKADSIKCKSDGKTFSRTEELFEDASSGFDQKVEFVRVSNSGSPRKSSLPDVLRIRSTYPRLNYKESGSYLTSESNDEELVENSDIRKNSAIGNSRPVSQSSNTKFSFRSRMSFQRPVSINWNDEANLELENSSNGEFNSNDTTTSNLVDSIGSISAPIKFSDSKSLSSSISTPSNLTQYYGEITDLGIAKSPEKLNSIKRISLHSVNQSNEKRFSTISKGSFASMMQTERYDDGSSAKSYLTYDSELSVAKASIRESYSEFGTNNLKKKKAFNNLRVEASKASPTESNLPEDFDASSELNRSKSSFRRSTRYSTLLALANLPFHDASQIFQDGDFSKSSNISIQDRRNNSIVESTQNTNLYEYSSFSPPGIDSYVLNELAAMPDESKDITDPIQHAFRKLEGDISKRNKTKIGGHEERDTQKDDSYFECTDDILQDINDANTYDIIEHSNQSFSDLPALEPLKTRQAQATEITDKYTREQANDETKKETLSPPRMSLNLKDKTDIQIEHVMENELHVSFLLSYRSEELAEHFTVIERDILQAIDWKELVELQWNRDITPVSSWLEVMLDESFFKENRGVNVAIARFNLMVNWIISEILLTKSHESRINLISRLIHVAQNCYKLQNYSTLMQIILALTSEKISVLKDSWNNLHPGDILILKNLEELASPWKNFVNLRMSLNQITPSKGCIPFVGLYLSDLIFNAERPSFIKVENRKEGKALTDFDLSAGGDSTLTSTNESEKMINFARFRTSVNIVKSLTQCIEWAANYQLYLDKELLSKCLYIKSLDEEQMNNCLSYIKR